jgi:hypothetical protein
MSRLIIRLCKKPINSTKVQLKKNVFVQSNSGTASELADTVLSEQLTPSSSRRQLEQLQHPST